MLNRRKFVNIFVTRLFGVASVGYNESDRSIVFGDDSIFGSAKLNYSEANYNNMKKFFKIAFDRDSARFYNKTKKGQDLQEREEFSNDMLIDNTCYYLEEYFNISIPKILNESEKKMLSNLLGRAIVGYIVPLIFSDLDLSKDKKMIDDDDLSSAFARVKTELFCFFFCQKMHYARSTEFSLLDGDPVFTAVNIYPEIQKVDFVERLYSDIPAKFVEKIFDSDYIQDECNYATCIDTSCLQIFSPFRKIPVLEIRCNETSKVEKSKSETPYEKFKDNFTEVYRLGDDRFISPLSEKIPDFKIPDSVVLEIAKITVSKTMVPKYVYFVTKIDKSLDDDIGILLNKANDVVKDKYRQHGQNYFKEITGNFFDLIESLLSSEFSKLLLTERADDFTTSLSKKVKGYKDLYKILNGICSERNIKAVWNYCSSENYYLNGSQITKLVICGVEELIIRICNLFRELFGRPIDMVSMELGESEMMKMFKVSYNQLEIEECKSKVESLFNKYTLEKLSEKRENVSFKYTANTGLKYFLKITGDIPFLVGKGEMNIYDVIKSTLEEYLDEIHRLSIKQTE